MEIPFDAPNEDPDESEMDCRVESGFWLAHIARAWVDKDGRLCVSWVFDSAPWSGHKIVDRLQVPTLCLTQSEVPQATQRMWVFACRIGLAEKGQKGKGVRIETDKMIGIRRVLEIVRAPSKKDGRVWTNIRYGGYWAEDRPEIPVADRVRLGLPLLPGQVLPTTTQAPPGPVATGKDAKGETASGGNGKSGAKAFDPSEV
jgi:hypothetical protein